MSFTVELLDPVVDFILRQPIKMQAKIHRTINLLEEFGWHLPEPHSKKLSGIKGLYELRVKVGTDICRLFYFHWKETTYIITSGYVKKTNKTDKA
ncbi:MAG: type II toxin-antitoxin system RelE/ParE family toxin, partial [Bacteroidota bacterium]|nr:type II toxin-antitoxin system RelE/ParE family toxin [Bacteroidota bacterium]